MNEPKVALHIIVKDGEKYIEDCLKHINHQSYKNFVVRVFDNNSKDNTVKIVKKVMPESEIILFDKNYFVGGAFNRSLAYSEEEFVVMVCVDVMIEESFIERAVDSINQDSSIGVLQAKVLYYNERDKEKTKIIDTTGMDIYRSRRIINRGHGELDEGQYKTGEVFCYEGAIPFFRREALESSKIKVGNTYEYLDEDFVWYADEVDLGWRMRLMGWKCFYDESVLAWHDRSTTHKLSGSRREFIKQRREIPSSKRMLDFRNQRLAIIKNDDFKTISLHTRYIIYRELSLFVYFLIFERTSLVGYIDLFKMLPLMLKKREIIQKKRIVSEKEIRNWFL